MNNDSNDDLIDPVKDPRSTPDEQQWLSISQRCFDMSTNYIESDIKTGWQRDIAHFQNRHAPGSKYNSPSHLKRSRIFRPKTRRGSMSVEAAAATAMFSNSDLLDIRSTDEGDPARAASAALMKSLVQHRLEVSIPWFLTVVGARQDCFVYGICASYQHWKFEEEVTDYRVVDEAGQNILNEAGEPTIIQRRTTTQDKPTIMPIPPENIRFDPGCDWRDPVNSSSFLIRIVPTYFEDVKLRMAEPEDKGGWREYPDATIKAHRLEMDHDTTKREREHGRPDGQIMNVDNPLVYVHENFIRRDGKEYVFWTLGSRHMLSSPRPLKDVHVIGERPIVIGRSTVETHKAYPMSDAGITSGLQEASNGIANQRFDNVELVLNKRYLIKRGAQVDVEALIRNVPGGGVVVNDIDGDLKTMDTPDVTGSSYNEQDRLDNQIDEMHGVFSQSTVQSNRTIGETVGGMNLSAGSATAQTDYGLRVFVETYIEPVLRQVVKLEAAYETDQTILAIAGKTAKLQERFGISEVTDDMLRGDCLLRVNVGIGATNPEQKVNKVRMAVESVAQLPDVASRINADEVIKEVFGALGFKNGERFVLPADKTNAAPPPPDPMVQVRQLELQMKQEQMQQENQLKQMTLAAQTEEVRLRQEGLIQELSIRREIAAAEMATKLQITREQAQTKMATDAAKLQSERDKAALNANITMAEMDLAREKGSGI